MSSLVRNAKYPAMVMSIIAGILFVEGGYVNHPSDPGGETNYGITKKVAVDHGFVAPLKDLPKETAIDIYAKSYIEKPNYKDVLSISEPVGTKLIDIGVNTGTRRASRWYQQLLNDYSRGCRDYPCISVDGVIGAASLEAHKGLVKKRGPQLSCKLMLRGLDAYQGAHYLSLKSLSDFTVGWFSNRIGNVSEDLCDE